jgi:hypothetical protein
MTQKPQSKPKAQADAEPAEADSGPAEDDAVQASDAPPSTTAATSAQPPVWSAEERETMRQRAHASYRRRSG